ncbi:MAG: hypothetical protein OEO23_13815 [Gemmatimonadota bacterium]|nr:hypothetical protein [Gemmatimonadota bacterium]
MGNVPPEGKASLRIRIARWMGFVVAVMPVVLGSTGGTEGFRGLALGVHLLLALPLFLALALGMRNPRRGAVAYVILGAIFLGGLLPGFGAGWSLAFAGPLLIIAALLM